LTILGDNILRKNTNLIHFIYPKSKQFLQTLHNICQATIGCGLAQTFKYKYYEHEYQECRLVKINETVKSELAWSSNITQYALDIIAVACHYSIRYKSSDEYLLESSNNIELLNSVFFMKDIQPNNLIRQFIDEFLDIAPLHTTNVSSVAHEPNMNISWKNMQYLWKQFLDTRNLPSVIFLNTLKNILIEKLKDYYNEELDSFVGICSKYLPAIQQFLQFWRETIIFDENETDFEIEELVILFKKWCINNDEYTYNLNDKQILDIISYFFPNIEFEKDKYICGIRSNLWDKQMDIHVALEHLKEIIQSNHYKNNIVNSPSINNNVSIYDAYNFYCKYTSNNEYDRQVVSKSYFEKYIFDNLSNYVIDSKFISMLWYII
jgi:hypothetical protein